LQASLQKKRDEKKVSSGEVEKMEESVKCLYEQLWKRYHGHSSTPPATNISQQTYYIQLALTALDKLAKDLKAAEPNLDESIQPEASEI